MTKATEGVIPRDVRKEFVDSANAVFGSTRHYSPSLEGSVGTNCGIRYSANDGSLSIVVLEHFGYYIEPGQPPRGPKTDAERRFLRAALRYHEMNRAWDAKMAKIETDRWMSGESNDHHLPGALSRKVYKMALEYDLIFNIEEWVCPNSGLLLIEYISFQDGTELSQAALAAWQLLSPEERKESREFRQKEGLLKLFADYWVAFEAYRARFG